MALNFNFKPVATIRARMYDSTSTISIQGVTTANTTPANAAAQMNKLLSIGGMSVIANTQMTRTQVEEAVDDDN